MGPWKRLFGRRKPSKPRGREPEVVLTESSVQAITSCLRLAVFARHEGVAYLLGLSSGDLTVVVSAVKPIAITSPGSFLVTPEEMAKVVRAAANQKLHVVGQVHTHPTVAYHSDGDVDGARIAYTGYISIVIPDYGAFLPDLKGAAVYVFRAPKGFQPVDNTHFRVAPAIVQ